MQAIKLTTVLQLAAILAVSGCVSSNSPQGCLEGSEPLLFSMHWTGGYGTDAQGFKVASVGRAGGYVVVVGAPVADGEGFAAKGTGGVYAPASARYNISEAQVRQNLIDTGIHSESVDYNISESYRYVGTAAEFGETCALILDEFYELNSEYSGRFQDSPALIMKASTKQGAHQVLHRGTPGPSELQSLESELIAMFAKVEDAARS